MHSTWYVLEDGSLGDPDEVALDAAGMLRHKSGAAVAYGPHGPRSRGVSAEDVAAAAAKKREAPARKDRELKAKPAAGYETR